MIHFSCSVLHFYLCYLLLLGLITLFDIVLSKRYHCNSLFQYTSKSIYNKCSKVTRLIVAGNLKSGTSNIAWHLGQHPDFYRPDQKEMNCLSFDSKECILLCYNYFKSCDVKSSQIVIDASPEYESLNPTAWNSILTNSSHIVFLIRKPNEWMVSMYLHNDYNVEKENQFKKVSTSEEEYEAKFLSFLKDINSKTKNEVTLYCQAKHIENYVQVFGKHRVHILRTDAEDDTESFSHLLNDIIGLYNKPTYSWNVDVLANIRVNTDDCRDQNVALHVNKTSCKKSLPIYYNKTRLQDIAYDFLQSNHTSAIYLKHCIEDLDSVVDKYVLF